MIVEQFTYRQLLAALQELPDESLDMPVVLVDSATWEASEINHTSLAGELPSFDLGELADEQPVLVR
jgi:hypothetical protein